MEPLLDALRGLLGLPSRQRASPAANLCASCRHFRNDPAYLEAAMPGLTSLSSASASVRADDGLCLRHDRYLGAGRSCADFTAAADES
jgi:hypothetical protein